MSNFISVILGLAMAGVVVVLMLGIGNFARGGDSAGKRSNKMMQLRILLQAIAVALIVLFVFFRNRGA